MIEINTIQSQVSFYIFDKLLLFLVESNPKPLSCEIFNLVMNKFLKLFSTFDEFYNRTS